MLNLSLFKRRQTAERSEGVLGAPELKCGVSLRHLQSLPVGFEDHFEVACNYIKAKTRDISGYRSYANALRNDPKTAHLVKSQADVFVSYAWGGGFGRTMKALGARLFPKGDSSSDVFVWMDFAIVDQHAAATTDVDFDEWRSIFNSNLVRTKKAMLVLTPVERPIAITRSWCCVEWVSIVESGIPYEYCVVPDDEVSMIRELQRGLGIENFFRMFALTNVEHAVASKPADQKRILDLMTKIGLIKVNDIVMNSLKDWLLQMIEKATQQSKNNPLVLTRVFNSAGALYRVMGNPDKALKANLQALKCAKSLSNNDANIAIQHNNLALVYTDLGKFNFAETNFREAVALWRRVHGESHPNIASGLHNLGYLFALQGRLREAEQFYIDAQTMREATLGPEHLETLLTIESLADVYREQENYEQAERLFERSLATMKRKMGDDHNHVGTILNDRGGMFIEQSRFAEAKADLERALEIHERNVGKFHVDLLRAQNALGRLYTETGELERAEEFIQSTLASRKRLLKNNHPEVALSTYALARLYVKQSKFNEAEALLDEVVAIQKRSFGSHHPDLTKTLEVLADIHKQNGKREAAQSTLKQALLSSRGSLGDDHPRTMGLKKKLDDV